MMHCLLSPIYGIGICHIIVKLCFVPINLIGFSFGSQPLFFSERVEAWQNRLQGLNDPAKCGSRLTGLLRLQRVLWS